MRPYFQMVLDILRLFAIVSETKKKYTHTKIYLQHCIDLFQPLNFGSSSKWLIVYCCTLQPLDYIDFCEICWGFFFIKSEAEHFHFPRSTCQRKFEISGREANQTFIFSSNSGNIIYSYVSFHHEFHFSPSIQNNYSSV